MSRDRAVLRPRGLPPAALSDNVRGPATDFNGERVRISVGRAAGLEPGKGKYLGTVTLTEDVTEKETVGVFLPARAVAVEKLRPEELPRKGDSVGKIEPAAP